MAFEMAIKTLKQTEALKKIRVDISEWLDKTEAEIAEIQLIGYATVDGKRKIVGKEVLQIIDKRPKVCPLEEAKGMIELNFFEKIVVWFKSLFINKEKAKENSDEIKREMCKRAVQGGICDHECDKCVWNTLDQGEK